MSLTRSAARARSQARDSRVPPHRWTAVAAIVGGLAWIPVRAAISVTFSQPLLGLTYVEWNRIEVVPIALMLLALAVGVRPLVAGAVRLVTTGLWVATAGLIGMLLGVIVEFWIAGGLSGNRELSIIGWGIYLLAGVATHLVGMVLLGIGLLRQRAGMARGLGALALVIGVLHALWIPSGFIADALLLADQALIGLAWVGIGGVMLATRPRGLD